MLVNNVSLFDNHFKTCQKANLSKKYISFGVKAPREKVDFDELERLEREMTERARKLFPKSKIPDPPKGGSTETEGYAQQRAKEDIGSS